MSTEITLIKIDGKPLEKLIGVISKGVGKLYKPKEIRKEADARAYEIRVIEEAKSMAKSKSLEIEQDTFQRMEERVQHRELNRQKNIDNINFIAAEQLTQEKEVSEEPLDDDWINRFFRIAEDVSNDEMQSIWGRILAGEVKRPKSYSIRTLELLKNITKEEAQVFNKFGQIGLLSGVNHFVYDPDSGKFLESEFDISFADKLILSEVGLISTKDNLELTFKALDKEPGSSLIFHGDKAMQINREIGAPIVKIQVIIFSKAGAELLQLLKQSNNMNYINKLGQVFKNNKVKVKYGDIVVFPGQSYQMSNAIDLV